MKRRSFIREMVLLSAAPLLLLPRKSWAAGITAQQIAAQAAGQRPSAASGPTLDLYTDYIEGTASPRNNFDGKVGMIWNNTSTVTLVGLGRWVISGNSQAHTVYLYEAANLLLTTLVSSVSVATSGAPTGAFKNVAVTPVSVPSGQYVICSEETNGGDQFYDTSSADAPVFSQGSYVNPAYSITPITFGTFGANVPYVPCQLQYIA